MFWSCQLPLRCRLPKALFICSQNARLQWRVSIFSGRHGKALCVPCPPLLLCPPRPLGQRAPAYTHLASRTHSVAFIASALSVELGTLRWKKGAWPCGWWSQEQALFVNKAPCRCLELSRGARADFGPAPRARLAPQGLMGPGKGQDPAGKESSSEGCRHLPACALCAALELGALPPSLPAGAGSPPALTPSASLFPCTFPYSVNPLQRMSHKTLFVPLRTAKID